jgi:diadenosine tetraphosphatase ApaH/serine/threonine PP2A family protein phosphatase
MQVQGQVSLAHGSPRDPVWEYIMNAMIAFHNLSHFQTPWCFVGHSHFQAIFQFDSVNEDLSIKIPEVGHDYLLKDRAILNPGSVGQPRDRDIRAAYAIFDPEENSWQPRRVSYDFREVQDRILKAGLPPRHAERLGAGW